ncbi:DNA translocase FtsK 4TM domain-containing protein, partial [Georgenia sp. 10Sc9-8]|nr:DNA translocase FtsK 4TM domain-containing protein [Georgenia halotolerans]
MLGRVLRGAWMGGAHVVGGTARRVGSGARDLDPELRRDGLAFLLLGLAIVIAAREWFDLSGIAGDVIHHVAAGGVGVLGVLLPLVLVGMAVRLMRHPERARANGRVSIGLSAITAAACGLLHVARDRPSPSESFAAVESAGGLVGWLLGEPLSVLLSVWVSVPLLVLLAVFGVLVVTATPVNRVPERVAHLGRRLTGSAGATEGAAPAAGAEEPGRPAPPRQRRSRREPAEVTPGEYAADEAFTQPHELAPGTEDATAVMPEASAASRGPGPARPDVSAVQDGSTADQDGSTAHQHGSSAEQALHAPPTQPLP